MEESDFVSRILNEHGGDDYLMIENLLSFRSESLANQFKDEVSQILCSNNREYYAADSECNGDFKKITTKKKRSRQSVTRDFSSLKFDMLESKNHMAAALRRDDTKKNEATEEGTPFNEGYEKEIKKRKDKDERSSKPSKKRKIQVQEEKPELPLAFKEKIGEMEGSEVKLVIQKELTMSDVDKEKSRLSIPIGKIEENFLTPMEKLSLDYEPQKKKERKKIVGMSVSVLDPNLILYDDMCFKKWKMGNREVYNITNKWNQLVAENHLKEKQKVQLWSFRIRRQLYFALVKL